MGRLSLLMGLINLNKPGHGFSKFINGEGLYQNNIPMCGGKVFSFGIGDVPAHE